MAARPRPISAAPAASSQAASSRERQRLATRERIYQAALEEFVEAGFASAQIDRIAEKAGVARGTFYFHFPTKEHVLIERQRRGEHAIIQQVRDLGPAPDSVAEFLRRVLDTIFSQIGDDSSLQSEILAMYVRRRMYLEPAEEPLIVAIADFLADAAERGTIRSDIPPEQLAVRFLGSLFLTLLGDADELAAERDLTIDIFLNGIAR